MPEIPHGRRRLHERRVKQLLKRSNLSGNFVVGKYRFSPYMACEHGCAYCDGRAEKYYVEGEFDSDIICRVNAPELLESELPKLRERGFVTMGSGVSDVYQPVEAELKITRSCLEVLVRHPFPVTLMTKSHLATRDMDLWKRLADGPGCMILTSLTFADDDVRRWIEPGASTVDERLELLAAAKHAGCNTGVLAMPLLPYISDTDEQVEALYARLQSVSPDFIMPAGLTLRPGKQKDFFIDTLDKHRPDLVDRYHDIYRNNRKSGIGIKEYSDRLYRRLNTAIRMSHIPFLVPHHVYASRLHVYDAIQVLLSHMDEIYSSRGIETAPLRESRAKYLEWLHEEKLWFNRHQSSNYHDLDIMLRNKVASGEIVRILGNERLGEFVRRVVEEGQTYDYADMKLTNADHSAG